MKIHALLVIFISISLSGCWSYNYAVERDGSPIPYKNQYASDDKEKYEFYSTLFKINPKKKHSDFVEITHLNNVDNHHHGTPKSTWRKSRLNFNFSKESGVMLIPNTVILEHYSGGEDLYKPSKVESRLSQCANVVGCRGDLVLHYEEGMSKNLLEKVSFTIVVNGKEKHISYTIPLEYIYHYSFWDVLMGV